MDVKHEHWITSKKEEEAHSGFSEQIYPKVAENLTDEAADNKFIRWLELKLNC